MALESTRVMSPTARVLTIKLSNVWCFLVAQVEGDFRDKQQPININHEQAAEKLALQIQEAGAAPHLWVSCR